MILNFVLYINYNLFYYFVETPNFRHEESDEESDCDSEDDREIDDPELDTPEQSTLYRHQT